MLRKCVLLSLVSALALISAAQGATIIWVADNLHYGSVEPNQPADQGFIDLLTAQGHEVVYKDQYDPIDGEQYWRELDPNKIDELNAADLIIIARDCASGTYDDANEAQWWNGVTTPIIMQGPHIARALPKWGWFNSTGTDAGSGVSAMQVVDPGHALFRGVELDPNNQVEVLVPDIKSEFVKGATDAGNGTVLATRADTGLVWIAIWEAGQEYYEGSTQIAGGARMFLASGAGGNKNNPVDGVYNLTAEGETIFLNAVNYMLNKNTTIIFVSSMHPSTADANVPSDQGFVDLLRAVGYTVDYTAGSVAGTGYWEGAPDPNKFAVLDAADLVILGRDLNSSGVAGDDARWAAWNGVKSPLMLMSSYIAANNRFKWLNSSSQDARKVYYDLEAVDPNHPIFAGVTLDPNNVVQWYDPNAASGYASFINTADAGSGTVLAVRPDNGNILIAEWPAGQEFYPGSGQIPADVRVFFNAGTQEVSGQKTNWGVMNLNEAGQKIFLNTVAYMLSSAEGFVDNFDAAQAYSPETLGAYAGILGAFDVLDADTSRPGALYLQTTGASWDPGPGPMLYVNVTGDFVATVKVVDFAGTSLDTRVFSNDSGIVARDPASGPGAENWVAMNYFPTWTGFIARNTVDSSRFEVGQTAAAWMGDDTFAIVAQYPWIQLERKGADFFCRISADGKTFIPLTDPGYQGIYDGSQAPLVINRPDFPETLQVGLMNCTYDVTTGYVAYDDFSVVPSGR